MSLFFLIHFLNIKTQPNAFCFLVVEEHGTLQLNRFMCILAAAKMYVFCKLQLFTRNSSGDKIANVNFFTTTSYTHYKRQDSCINSTTDGRGDVLEQVYQIQ